jgi:hypothetical protein
MSKQQIVNDRLAVQGQRVRIQPDSFLAYYSVNVGTGIFCIIFLARLEIKK